VTKLFQRTPPPIIPTEILKSEISRHADFPTLLAFSATCRDLRNFTLTRRIAFGVPDFLCILTLQHIVDLGSRNNFACCLCGSAVRWQMVRTSRAFLTALKTASASDKSSRFISDATNADLDRFSVVCGPRRCAGTFNRTLKIAQNSRLLQRFGLNLTHSLFVLKRERRKAKVERYLRRLARQSLLLFYASGIKFRDVEMILTRFPDTYLFSENLLGLHVGSQESTRGCEL
jgi:hypothetical protein